MTRVESRIEVHDEATLAAARALGREYTAQIVANARVGYCFEA